MANTTSGRLALPAPSAAVPWDWLRYFAAWDRRLLMAICILCVALCGIIDNATGGLRLAFAVTYAVPIAFGTWFVSSRFGIVLVVLSVLAWLASDIAAGVQWAHPLIPVWNASLRMAYYVTIVVLLARLHELQGSLEERVRERTAALTRALEDRRRLEHELLEISDREQRRMGADLHDTLSQHLAGTALACAVLAKRLDTISPEEAERARKIVRLVEEGTALSRNVAKGLNPVELFDEGLMFALRDYAANVSKMFNVDCSFECEYPVLFDNPSTTVQLFRIAQEAVTNAVKHGKATEIVIALSADEDSVTLKITDNGVGIPASLPSGKGMGLRIMGHRANLIDAALHVGPRSGKGTVVTCILPIEISLEESRHG